MKIDINIINAFVEKQKGGNPAGVVLDATALTSEQKQTIATKAGYSETAFVSDSEIADFKLDFFTPTRQIAHCGHATIATFSYLKQIGRVTAKESSKETIDGRREIIFEGDSAYMEQLAPQYTDVSSDLSEIAASLNLPDGEITKISQALVVNTGNSFLIVALEDEESLANLKPDFDKIYEISERYDLIGYYVFSPGQVSDRNDASARMFAPRYGILEESATGMAGGPLACYLYDKLNIRQDTFVIRQGHLMAIPSPSLITVNLRLKDGIIQNLIAGGQAALIKTITVEI